LSQHLASKLPLLGIQQRCLIDLKAAKESNSKKMQPGSIEQNVSISYPVNHVFFTSGEFSGNEGCVTLKIIVSF
jgi:hypothetical protein